MNTTTRRRLGIVPFTLATALFAGIFQGHPFTFDFRDVWVMEDGPVLTGQLWNTSLTKPWDYRVEAPQAPFTLVGGSLSGTLQPLETAEIRFGMQAPYVPQVSTRYTQTLRVSDRADWILTTIIKGPGLTPEARFVLPETSCLDAPIEMDASGSFDPDDEGAEQRDNGIAKWSWRLWDPNGDSVRVGGRTVTWRPRIPGTYTVELKVTDREGDVGVATATCAVAHVLHEPIDFVGSCRSSGAVARPIKRPVVNGDLEIECKGGMFEVRWIDKRPGVGTRFIGLCRYENGINGGTYFYDTCTKRITSICWGNREYYKNDPLGECAGRIDEDFYCYDVEKDELTILKVCYDTSLLGWPIEPLNRCGCGFGPTAHRITKPAIVTKPAPDSRPALLDRFGRGPTPPRSPGSESRGRSTYLKLSGMARQGSLSLRARGGAVRLSLRGAESAAEVAEALAAAVDSDLTLRSAGVEAFVLPPESADDGIQLALANVPADEQVWELIGQEPGGLGLVLEQDVPSVEIEREGMNIRVNWAPHGSRYTLQEATLPISEAPTWRDLPSADGTISLSVGTNSRALRVLFAGRRSVLPRLPGLRGWWSGDGTLADLVGSARGTMSHGVDFDSGVVGTGLRFDGVSGYVSLSEAAAVSGRGPFGVALWLKTTQAGQRSILSQRAASVDDAAWSLSLRDGTLEWAARGTGAKGPSVLGTRTVNDGAPHLVVGLRESDGTLRLYVDGVLNGSAQGAPRPMVPQAVAAGVDLRELATSDTPSFFKGMLDEIQIYGRALTPADIQAIFEAGEAGMAKLP